MSEPSPPATPGRLLRTGLFVASVAVVVAAALLVPMPLVETAPGLVADVEPLLTVEGPVTEVDGRLGLLAVRVDQPSMVETLRAVVDDRRTLRDRDEVIPGPLDQRTYVELQQQSFRRAFRVAAAAGLRAAGQDVGIRTAPQVIGVQPGGPADGRLRIGDVIRRFDDHPVDTIDDLQDRARQASVGDRLTLQVERADALVDVVVRAARVPGLEHPGMGISLQTLEEDVDLPVPVELVDQRDIGGPSAGLMIAVTVYDLVADEDLARGRTVVGTGTVDGQGVVGRIGSIREKALTAVAAGADVMLAPASQAAEARAVAGDDLTVVGVRTVEDALAALRR